MGEHMNVGSKYLSLIPHGMVRLSYNDTLYHTSSPF